MRIGSLALLLAMAAPDAAMAADAAHPTVVELFQSQGCSSCPPADANLNAIAGRADILALSFAVTYWDQLGWKDSFARPAFTQRQWAYAKAGGRRQVATPQMILNGRVVINGGDRAQLAAALVRADRGASGPAIATDAGRVVVGAGSAPAPARATVWLIGYDPRVQNVAIRAGENGGKTLPHRNIVTLLQPLGRWTGTRVTLPLPRLRADPHRRLAVLVQAGEGGPIIAARRI